MKKGTTVGKNNEHFTDLKSDISAQIDTVEFA